MQVSSWVWALFALMVLAVLAADLGVFRPSRRGPREVTLGSAAWWSAAWIGLSLLFGVVILIFSELRIPPDHQRRVLYWGVLGALASRALLIAGGVFLLRRFNWIVY